MILFSSRYSDRIMYDTYLISRISISGYRCYDRTQKIKEGKGVYSKNNCFREWDLRAQTAACTSLIRNDGTKFSRSRGSESC